MRLQEGKFKEGNSYLLAGISVGLVVSVGALVLFAYPLKGLEGWGELAFVVAWSGVMAVIMGYVGMREADVGILQGRRLAWIGMIGGAALIVFPLGVLGGLW